MTVEHTPINIAAGPATSRQTPERRETTIAKKRTAIGHAVWEASQFMPLDEIATYVRDILTEIRSDDEA